MLFKHLHIQSQRDDENCTVHEIESFLNWFTYEPMRIDIIIVCLLITIYVFYGLGILYNEYCLPSLEKLCSALRMSYSVAGATILALANSVPEFWVHLYATFLTEGDMGVGAIVGAAVFNAMAVTALCGLYTVHDIQLDWWPITRDVLWYLLAVLLLAIFVYDGRILLYEAAIFVATAIINLICTLLDPYIQRLRNQKRTCPCYCFVPVSKVADFNVSFSNVEEDEETFNFKHWPLEPSCSQKILWILSYPLHCLFFITIPNIKKKWTRNCYVVSLIMSVLWIGIFSYIITWMLTAISLQMFLPSSLMGSTLLAVGTNLPEAILAVIVTKKGYGSMSACAAISANSIHIYFCLGFPWFIKCLTHINNATMNYVAIRSVGLFNTVFVLYLTTCTMYTILMLGRFRLNRLFGLFCTFLYLSFFIIMVAIETNTKGRNICHIKYIN